MIITIDGPAGTGKSTVAQKVAEKLGFMKLDTGALYRAIAAGCIHFNIDPKNEMALETFLLSFPLKADLFDETPRYFIQHLDVTDQIRSHSVTSIVSFVAASPAVRKALLPIQRALAKGHNLVCEGRDMGTTVFPNANIKFFLTASPEERAKRRFLELEANGKLQQQTQRMIQEQIEQRDTIDSNRKASPLAKAHDAIEIDTSSMSIDEVVLKLISVIQHTPE